VAYKPKKAGEDDPQLKEMLDRGLRYVGEFATPEGTPSAGTPAGDEEDAA